MIKEFVRAWDVNKEKLSEYIASHTQEEFDTYKKIVSLLFEHVINPYNVAHGKYSFDLENLHEIDDGEYQGTLLYIIPFDTYQPSSWEYVFTFVEYGSCSGCDTLLGILGSIDDDELPDSGQVKEVMDLCLYILQHCKFLRKFGEDE